MHDSDELLDSVEIDDFAEELAVVDVRLLLFLRSDFDSFPDGPFLFEFRMIFCSTHLYNNRYYIYVVLQISFLYCS